MHEGTTYRIDRVAKKVAFIAGRLVKELKDLQAVGFEYGANIAGYFAIYMSGHFHQTKGPKIDKLIGM